MFTSRAEYRLSLREDNADLRLTGVGRELGCIDDRRWDAFSCKRDAIEQELRRLRSIWVNPKTLPPERAVALVGQPIEREHSLADLLRRPDVEYDAIRELSGGEGAADPQVAEQVTIQLKYAGYIARQQQEIARHEHNESLRIPDDFDYAQVRGLSFEVRQKLAQHRPETVGQAGRVSGVTPAAISLLLVYLKKRRGTDPAPGGNGRQAA